MSDTMLATLALFASAGSLLLLAVQTRQLVTQTRVLRAASELTLNVEIMRWLQYVLLDIADHPDSYATTWGDNDDCRRTIVATQAVNDVLQMALAAVERLPGFAVNSSDWKSYAEYVMDAAPAVRREVLEHPEWWPEIRNYAEAAAAKVPPPAP